MKKIILGVLSLALLCSCSKDEYEGVEYTTDDMPRDNGDTFVFPITYPNLAVTLDSNIPKELITFTLGGKQIN